MSSDITISSEPTPVPEQAIAAALEMIANGLDPAVVAQRLRSEFALGPIQTIKALRIAGVPLAVGKGAVDQTLSAGEARATEHVRDLAIQVLEGS